MQTRLVSSRGYTLIELMLTIALGVVVMGMAIGGIPSLLKTAKADGGLEIIATALRSAREMSVGYRRNVELSFVGTNGISLVRVEYPSGDLTTLRTTMFEGRVEYTLVSGVPDTPDAFGNSTAIGVGSNTPVMFTPDGSFCDSNGDYLNATIFIGVPGDSLSARAVTIFGATGAIHLWKWDGRQWIEG